MKTIKKEIEILQKNINKLIITVEDIIHQENLDNASYNASREFISFEQKTPTNKDIVLTALKEYKLKLDLKNNYYNFDTVEKIEQLINYIK